MELVLVQIFSGGFVGRVSEELRKPFYIPEIILLSFGV